MPRGNLTPEEDAAGKIVARQLSGAYEPRDVSGAPDKTHDLDVVLADGRKVPVEVTSVVDSQARAVQRLALERTWPAPSLNHHWWLGLPKNRPVRVRSLMTGVVPYLKVLERYEVGQVGGAVSRGKPPDDAPLAIVDAARGVFALGADRATRLGLPDRGETALVMASIHGGASSNFDKLNALVATSAEAKADKLTVAPGHERHLFVWMHDDDAALAMRTLAPPADTPTLPKAVDVVWVATGPEDAGALCGRLYRLRPPGNWEVIDARSDSAAGAP